jgi:serine/threonine protein kinase
MMAMAMARTRADLGTPTRGDSFTASLPAGPRVPVAIDAARVFKPGAIVAKRYRIVRFLAAGGMGEVYEAEDLALQCAAALKTLRVAKVADERALRRFRREILLGHRVTHPGVCRTFDLGLDGPMPFLTMELLHGETLAARISRDGPLRADEVVPLVAQLAAALTAAHDAGVVHRDLKSQNIMLVPDGGTTRAVITDFGLALSRDACSPSGEGRSSPGLAITHESGIAGTPGYMAPEQRQGASASPAVDIYALGVVIYEMLTGDLPFGRDALDDAQPWPGWLVPGLAPRWEQVVRRCLAPRPEDRFARAADVAAALATPRRRRWLAPAGALLATAIAVAVAAVIGSAAACRGIEGIRPGDTRSTDERCSPASAPRPQPDFSGAVATPRTAFQTAARAASPTVPSSPPAPRRRR